MRNIVLAGACLSIACEMTQYITKRGCADINDVLFNIFGIIVGVTLAFKVRGSKYQNLFSLSLWRQHTGKKQGLYKKEKK